MIETHFAEIRSQIATATKRSGREETSVELVAVSKTHGPEVIQAAVAAGQTLFGENRVQEALAKMRLLQGGEEDSRMNTAGHTRLRWHFIGHLQKNKLRQALPHFECFHGVDSVALAREMDRVAGELGLHPKVLLEVNTGGEASKFGFPPDALRQAMAELLELRRVSIAGLMTIPPPVDEAEKARRFFAGLREWRERLEQEFAHPLPELSMGMSGDFSVAIEEGATLVRIGSALFGERQGKTWRP